MQKRISNPVIPTPNYAPRNTKKEEPTVELTPCLQCGKEVKQGYYGRYHGGGVCSRACDTFYSGKPQPWSLS